jgi:hypothetical protein
MTSIACAVRVNRPYLIVTAASVRFPVTKD